MRDGPYLLSASRRCKCRAIDRACRAAACWSRLVAFSGRSPFWARTALIRLTSLSSPESRCAIVAAVAGEVRSSATTTTRMSRVSWAIRAPYSIFWISAPRGG